LLGPYNGEGGTANRVRTPPPSYGIEAGAHAISARCLACPRATSASGDVPGSTPPPPPSSQHPQYTTSPECTPSSRTPRCPMPNLGISASQVKRTSTLAINPGPTLPNVSFPSEEGTQNSHAPIAARRSKPPALERDWLRSAVRFFFFPPACDSSRGPSGSPSRYTIGGAPCSARWSPLEPRAVPPESAD
jgi:hypothetical protein